MKLSLIICVYNTDKAYLDECLGSLTRGTLSAVSGEYEICMVDDGSDIDYSELVEKYGISYVKTENRGIYSARKTGAFMAKGEFSAFCDSDDTVSFNYHKAMLDKAVAAEADIVINDWAFHTQRARYFCKNDSTINSDFDFSGNDVLKAFFAPAGKEHAYFVLWNKLYKTELLREAFVSLDEAGIPDRSSYSEDAAINFFAFQKAKRMVNIHSGYYFYRLHSSQTVNVISEERLKSQILFMSKTLDIMEESLNDKTLIAKLDEWRALMSRVHYSHAKSNKYTSLYPLIKEKYRVGRLSLSTYSDGKCYSSTKLLGDNFPEIEAALIEAWQSEEPVRLIYSSKDSYAKRSAEFLISANKTDDNSGKAVTVPKAKNSFINKLLHNAVIYKISLRLFKKGSRIRALLKKMF